MPPEGLDWVPRDELLTFEEIERVSKLLVEQFGIESIRITGGEPTVRAHLPVLIKKLSQLPVDLSMTTNGATLRTLSNDLVQAGLKRINISLDSLRADRFAELTLRDNLPQVLDGIQAAVDSGLSPVKVNMVVMAGVNDDEIIDFARFGREHGVIVRYIEFMPLDASEGWTTGQVVKQEQILDQINSEFPLAPVQRTSAPALMRMVKEKLGSSQVLLKSFVTHVTGFA